MEDSPHQKYYLSKKACLGILRRAELRGKELPEQLRQALHIQADISSDFELENSEEPLVVLADQGGNRMDIEVEKTPTLRANMGGHQPLISQPTVLASTRPNAEICKDLSPTITSSGGSGGGNLPILINKNIEIYDNNAQDCRYKGPLEIAPTVTASYGSGGNNTALLKNPLPKMEERSYCIAGNIIGRKDKNGGNGIGCSEEISYTITATDRHSVAQIKPYQDVVGALMHRDYKGVNSCYVNQNKCIISPKKDDQKVFGQSSYGSYDGSISTLTASGGTIGGGSENLAISKNLVRRLTPLECERLQGFPDNWTNIKGASDSPRYKSIGNSICIPCVEFIMKNIADFLQNTEEKKEN